MSDALPTTPEAAQAAIEQLETSPEYRAVAFDRDAAGRGGLLARRAALYEAAYPTKTPARPEAVPGDADHGLNPAQRDNFAGLANEALNPPPATETELQLASIGILGHGASEEEADEASRAFVALAAPAGVGAQEARSLATLISEGLRKPHGIEAAEQSLRSIWTKPGEFDANLRAARGLVAELATKAPGLPQWLEETQLGNDPRLLMQLARIGRRKGLG